MPVDLIRRALLPLYRGSRSIHPGLMIQRGLEQHDADDSGLKKAHIGRICEVPVPELYGHAYHRWLAITADPLRFKSLVVSIEGRLFIGLSGGGALESGCAVSHSYGVPYLPGSSIKGITRQHVSHTSFGQLHGPICDELLGAGPTDPDAEGGPDPGRAGLVTFHDAWWVPGSAPRPHTDRPFAAEVVTTHHPGYYQHEGREAASDFDSPVPNAQIAVHGSFLITLEGDPGWTELAEQMLVAALAESGIGAKTRAGYGYAEPNDRRLADVLKAREPLAAHRAAWVERQRKERAEAIKRNARQSLNEHERIIDEARDIIAKRLEGQGMGAQRDAVLRILNNLLETAVAWSDSAERAAAADLIAETYNKIGWADPGGNTNKRRRQRDRREQKIDELRAGRGPHDRE